jgi:hypothetical protein
MLLHEYLEHIRSVIDGYADLILASDAGADFRTDKIGIIRGRIDFFDESTAHFMEYLDLRYGVEKLSYSIHYQNRAGELVFRYDNASHKPKLDFQDHKHLPNGQTIPAKLPEFEDVLIEIVDHLL